MSKKTPARKKSSAQKICIEIVYITSASVGPCYLVNALLQQLAQTYGLDFIEEASCYSAGGLQLEGRDKAKVRQFMDALSLVEYEAQSFDSEVVLRVIELEP